jgi:peroxiredoxin
MKKIILLLSLALVLFTTSYAKMKGHAFRIMGTAVGFADSTWMYLDDITSSSPVPIDSTLLINNHFRFDGVIKEKTMHAVIRTRNFRDYKFFWLENAVIEFSAEKGKFRNAGIVGSTTQEKQEELDSLVAVKGNEKEQDMVFIGNNPSSIVSAYILSVYCSTWGRDTTVMLYGKLSKDNQDTYYGRNISEYIALNKNVKIGDQYVDFSEQDTQGQTVKLSDFKGRYVLLDFWASWCGPCREENPRLVKTYHAFSNKGFAVLGVSVDDDKKFWLDAVKTDSLSWPNVSDLKGTQNKAALMYGVSYYPCNFLISPDGRIIAKDLRGEALEARLKEIFK